MQSSLSSVCILFPHQLFDVRYIKKVADTVLLIEDPLFFKDEYHGLIFHTQKYIFHRASMKAYEDELTAHGITVIYVSFQEAYTNKKGCEYLSSYIDTTKQYYYFDTIDYILEKRLSSFQQNHHVAFIKMTSPNFFLSEEEVKGMLPKSPYRLTPMYIALRKKYAYLMEGNTPLGGKWTYDTENRKKIPASMEVKESLKEYTNAYIEEARTYTATHFKESYGQGDTMYYAVTRKEAKDVFDCFLYERFSLFGPYEDAILTDNHVLFHSTISAYLNVGLLDPREVVEDAISHGLYNNVPLASIEGFVRQVLGWREFIRGVYVVSGVEMRKKNFFGYTKKIPESFWKGGTGVVPLDTSIFKVLKTAYLHHIERLMVMGNYMLLEEYAPDQVYRWFMELFIDAYDWVMVPNVYGMITYSDGGTMTTKPYVSGANYLLKMSDYTKGDWGNMWTAKYWAFIKKHRAIFEKNPRMRMLINRHDTQ